jgi:hypothetical protein
MMYIPGAFDGSDDRRERVAEVALIVPSIPIQKVRKR